METGFILHNATTLHQEIPVLLKVGTEVLGFWSTHSQSKVWVPFIIKHKGHFLEVLFLNVSSSLPSIRLPFPEKAQTTIWGDGRKLAMDLSGNLFLKPQNIHKHNPSSQYKIQMSLNNAYSQNYLWFIFLPWKKNLQSYQEATVATNNIMKK